MKLLFVLLFSITLLNADYLINANGMAFCATDYAFNDSQNSLNTIKSSDNSILTLSLDDIRYITGGYEYQSGLCKKQAILSFLGIEFEQYNFLLGLTALLLGFITLFFMLFVTLEVTKK